MMKIIKVKGIALEVHSDGTIFSVPSSTGRRNMGRYKKRAKKNKSGYHLLGLYLDGRRTLISIHRLVAEAFLEDWNPELTVDHIDADKSNNDVSNLRMLTRRENAEAYYKEQQVKLGLVSQGVRKYGYKNVGMNKFGRYTAAIRIGKNRVYGGAFLTPIEAAIAVNDLCVKNNLEFYRFNIPLMSDGGNTFTLSRLFARY